MSFRLPVNTLLVIVKNTVNSLSAGNKMDIVKNEVRSVRALKIIHDKKEKFESHG